MSFESILQVIIDGCSGALGIALMESDGIPIAQVQGKAAASDPLAGDIGSAGVEFGRIIGDITKAAHALNGGALHETVITLDRMTLIFHHVEDDIALVFALAPEANLGKARYLIRRHLLALRQEL